MNRTFVDMTALRWAALLTVLGLAPVAGAQRVEAAAVIEVVKTGHEEGAFGVGGRLDVALNRLFAVEAQATYGMPLGDGDSGDLLGTVGIRVRKHFRSSELFVALRPGIVVCPDGNCAIAEERAIAYFATYAGTGIQLNSEHVFFRADAGAIATRGRGLFAVGIGLGAQF